MFRAFDPQANGTVNIDVSSSSQRVALGGAALPRQFYIKNDGTATVWIAQGDVSITTAATTGMPIGAGVETVLTLAGTHVAAIAAGATGKIYFTPGSGL